MFDELGKVEKLYRQHPQSPLFARLADLYLRRGKVERAIALCQEGCRRFPHYPTGYIILGKCYEAQGQLEEARSATDQALRLDPENPAGFMRLSKIYQDLGITTLALKSLQQAARFDPLSDKLAEQVDRLTYVVRVESTTAPNTTELPDVPLTSAPVPMALQKIAPPPAADEEADEPFGVIHTPHTEAPAAAEEPTPENQEEFSATYGPLEEESLEDLLKRSEEAMAEREIRAAERPAIPTTAPAAAETPDLPMEDRLEALFRRGDLFAEPAATPPELIAPPEPEPESIAAPPRQPVPALDEDLFALGAALMAGDSPLATGPEPASIAEPEPSAQQEPAPESLVIQEEGLFSPAAPDTSPIAIEPADETLEEGLFATLSSGIDLPANVALPPGESTAAPSDADLIGAPAPPTPLPAAPPQPEVAFPPALAETPPPPPTEEKVQTPPPPVQAEALRQRRADDGELIRLFQEIENQQQQELASQPPAIPQGGPGPLDRSDPEGRIATVTLAQIYSSQGFVDRAVETYRKILDQDPDNEEIKRRIAELQQGRKAS